MNLDQLCVDTLRFLSVDAVEKADSGHPGLPLGAAPMAYVLWTRFLRHSPANPSWFDRDRFVLSAGHGSALLYSLLHLSGYDLGLDDLKAFRQWGSRTPGHPDRGLTPGVEITTGPLGQGFGNAVGMAMAEAHLAARFNQAGHKPVNHFTYVLAGDGDLMEGVASEAASLAGHLRLGKLICLYDDNQVTLSAGTHSSFTEDRAKRFQAYGWHTRILPDGNDLEAIEAAICAAQLETGRPSLILVRTHIGFGSPKQDSFKAHGSPLGPEDTKLTKRKLGWPEEPAFIIPPEVAAHFREALVLGEELESVWANVLRDYAEDFPDEAKELKGLMDGGAPAGWDAEIPVFPADPKGMASRAASQKVLEAIAPKLPGLFGGSADLNPSTLSALKGLGDFEEASMASGDLQGSAGGAWDYAGRNIQFGVREHAMGAALNGLAAHGGLLPYGATFFVFSDYLRPTMRLAAMMGLHVVYVFTHDSLGVGEDGATHQPIEHLASLRAIPGLTLIRPGDANETAQAWRAAVEASGPVALVLSRQAMPTLDRSRFAPAQGLRQGAYVLSHEQGKGETLVLIATGTELGLIVEAGAMLQGLGHPVRLVSMPSWELFEAQPRAYREAVLPPSLRRRLAVEAGVGQGWSRYVGDAGDVLSVERYGASAPGAKVLMEYGFSAKEVCRRALEVLARPLGPQRDECLPVLSSLAQ
ncbi:MAG TPA: transketolase [bacterium]|nr:transketolase [bacterium]